MVKAVCGAVGKYDKTILDELRKFSNTTNEPWDSFEDTDVAISSTRQREKNTVCDDRDEVCVALAGNSFLTIPYDSGSNFGAKALANSWHTDPAATSRCTSGAFFAVIYDSLARKCYGLSDFVGQFPLYYLTYDGATYFSSRLRPFLRSETLPKAIDPVGLDLFFTFGCIPGSNSILSGVKKTLPATLNEITPKGIYSKRYWNWKEIKTDRSKSLERWTDEIEASFRKSVTGNLELAERPLGVLLGGLDSSLVAVLLRKLSSERIVALTASFENDRFNERGPARVSDLSDLDLKEVPITCGEMPSTFVEMAEAYEEPVSDMVASPVAFSIVRKARSLVNTLFDGTGADDLFQGIAHHHRKAVRMLNKLPGSLTSCLRSPERHTFGMFENSEFFSSPVEREVNSRIILSAGQLTKSGCTNVQNFDVGRLVVRGVDSDLRGAREDPMNFMAKTAVGLYFAPTHGFDYSRNRALMTKFNLPVFSPFYDFNLYMLGLSVPWYYKTPSSGLSKPLLRYIAVQKNLLPRDIAYLKKMGLGSSRQGLNDTQIALWLKHELADWMKDEILGSLNEVKHLIDKEKALKLLEHGKISQASEILTFILWYRNYFGDQAIPLGSTSSPMNRS